MFISEHSLLKEEKKLVHLFSSIETETVRVSVSAVLRYSEQVYCKSVKHDHKPLPAYLFSSIYNVQ